MFILLIRLFWPPPTHSFGQRKVDCFNEPKRIVRPKKEINFSSRLRLPHLICFNLNCYWTCIFNVGFFIFTLISRLGPPHLGQEPRNVAKWCSILKCDHCTTAGHIGTNPRLRQILNGWLQVISSSHFQSLHWSNFTPFGRTLTSYSPPDCDSNSLHAVLNDYTGGLPFFPPWFFSIRFSF